MFNIKDAFNRVMGRGPAIAVPSLHQLSEETRKSLRMAADFSTIGLSQNNFRQNGKWMQAVKDDLLKAEERLTLAVKANATDGNYIRTLIDDGIKAMKAYAKEVENVDLSTVGDEQQNVYLVERFHTLHKIDEIQKSLPSAVAAQKQRDIETYMRPSM